MYSGCILRTAYMNEIVLQLGKLGVARIVVSPYLNTYYGVLPYVCRLTMMTMATVMKCEMPESNFILLSSMVTVREWVPLPVKYSTI